MSDRTNQRLMLMVMCVGYFLVLLDVTVVNVALPAMAAGLGAGVPELQWVVDGYAVALAALLLAGGTVGDRYGHKPVVLTGLTVFGLASLACGLAPTAGVLVASRVAQGVGAALLLPGTLAVVTRSFPTRAGQARAIGVWAGVGSIALPIGPLLGGLLVQGPGWRWVFLVNVPIVLLAGLVAARTVRAEPVAGRERLDVAGTLLGAAVLATVTVGVIEAGRRDVVVAVVAGVVAVAAVAAFLHVERAATDPMLPLGLFRRPAFSVANGAAAVMNLGTLGMLFLLTLFLQSVQHRSPEEAGLALLPLFVPLAVIAPLGGRWAARAGPVPGMRTGLLLAAGGVATTVTWTAASGYPVLLPALLAWGVGLGVLTPAVVGAAVAAVPSASAGLASGVNNAARQAGGAIGIAAYGAVAGPPGHVVRFLGGLHVAGAATATLFVGAAAATVALRGAAGRP